MNSLIIFVVVLFAYCAAAQTVPCGVGRTCPIEEPVCCLPIFSGCCPQRLPVCIGPLVYPILGACVDVANLSVNQAIWVGMYLQLVFVDNVSAAYDPDSSLFSSY